MARCAGCGQEKDLLGSHIIPEFFWKFVYTKDHKFVEITADNKDKLETKQKGLREPLLCADCEQALSRLEKDTAEFVRQLASGNSKTITIHQLPNNIILVNGHKYDAIKRCLLSILWRTSISSLDAFKDYALGPYSEQIRTIVFGSSQIAWNEFPITMERVMFTTQSTSELMMLHKPGKYKEKTLYSITLAGFNFDFIIDPNYSDLAAEIIYMRPVDMVIKNIQFGDLKVGQNFLNRFNDKDVTDFFNKHK